MRKVILIHGNGGNTVSDHWFPYVKQHLTDSGIAVIAQTFPDNNLARSSHWIPFLRDELKADAETVLVGHSSGAVCAMRCAEQNPLLGSVLVGVHYTALGIKQEEESGYFDTPWNWEAIRNNQQWIAQFASKDDPWVPIKEARHVHDKLQTEYFEYEDRGHFGGDRKYEEFPECVELLKKKLVLK